MTYTLRNLQSNRRKQQEEYNKWGKKESEKKCTKYRRRDKQHENFISVVFTY